MNAAALVKGAEVNTAALGLSPQEALLLPLQPVVHGIAHQVQKRVRQLLDHGPVDLGVLSGAQEIDLLAGLYGEVPHEPLHSQEG